MSADEMTAAYAEGRHAGLRQARKAVWAVDTNGDWILRDEALSVIDDLKETEVAEHDPMCGWAPDVVHADGSVTMTPCRCVLIAAVRADQRAFDARHDHVCAYDMGRADERAEMAGPLDNLVTFAEAAQSTAYAAGIAKGREDAAAAVAALPVAHYESGIALVQASRAITAARTES